MIPRVIIPRVIIMLVLSSPVASEVVVMTTHGVTTDNKVGIMRILGHHIILVWGSTKIGTMTILGHHLALRKHQNWYHDDSGPSSWSEKARKLFPWRFWAIILVWGSTKIVTMTILCHHLALRKHQNWYHDDSVPSFWSEEAWKLVSSWRFRTIILVWVGVSHASTNQERWWSRITMKPTSMMSISIPIMSMHSHLIYSQVPL